MKSDRLMIIGGAGGSSAPSIASDTLAANATIEFVDGICEGEILGFPTSDPLESIYYDDTPLKRNGEENFDGVAVDYRLGTQSQTHFEGETDSSNPNASLEFTVNTEVTKSTPVTRTVNNANTNAVAVTVIFPNGIYRQTDKGDIEGVYVDLTIKISCAATGFVPQTINSLGSQGSFKEEKTSSSYSRTIEFSLADYGDGPYDISVHRLSVDDENAKTHTAFSWSTYTEIIYAKLRYPNTVVVKSQYAAKSLSSIPRRGFVLLGKVVKVPNASVYNPIARTYTGAFWDGTFTTSFTRNPVWIQYDILTNPRYGLGNEIDESTIDKWGLFSIAKRCDELVPDGNGGTEPRYSLDLYIQRSESAKKVIQDIAAAFDGMTYWGNGSVFVTQDSPKPVKAIFTNANVVEGRFAYIGAANQTRYTACMVQWNDPDNLFKSEIEYVEDPDGIARFGYRDKQVVAIGCTSRAQAHRFGKRILLTSQLETDSAVFSVGLEGMVVAPGDVVGIRDIIRTGGNRLGGRVGIGSTTSAIELDSPVTIGAGETHYISIVLDDGEILTGTITNAAGDHQTVNVSVPLSSVPQTHNVWAVYTSSNESKLYRVVAIGEGDGSANTTYSITTVEYTPEKYDIIDSPLSLQPSKQALTTILGDMTGENAPSDLIAKRTLVADESGPRMHIDISWTPGVGRFADEYMLKWARYDEELHTVPNITGSPTYRMEDAKPGVYIFELRAKNIIGSHSPAITAVFRLLKMYAVTDVTVTNVAVRGIDDEFFGKDAEFSWETDAATSLNIDNSYSNGSGGTSQWFRDFEVSIYDGGGVLRRTEYVSGYSYVYTYDKNVEDGEGTPIRKITIRIKARDQFDMMSMEGSMIATNNPPTAFPLITFLPSEGNLYIKFSTPIDYDYSYTRIFASRTQGFTPSDNPNTGNLLWSGSENFINIPIKSEHAGLWYVRAQIVDEFGLTGTYYTPEVSQEVFAVAGGIDAVTADNIVKSITDFDASNNRNSDSIANPIIATDGTAIDHTVNADGTIDVSFEWAWTGDEGDIDGFAIYVHADSSSTPYVFSGFSSNEVVFQVPAYSRTYIWRGVSADSNYTAGVAAYRKVDKDVNSTGLINSSLITVNGPGENPYYPPAENPASGDITTTIDGILSGHVNQWDYVEGNNRPFDNADVTSDQISGSGVNIVNGEYSSPDASEYPPFLIFNGNLSVDPNITFGGRPMSMLAATGPNASITMSDSETGYNFILTPNRKWILSVDVLASIANAPGQIHVKTSDAGVYHTVSFLTSPIGYEYSRVSGEIDLSLDDSRTGLIRFDNDAGAGVDMWFAGIMLEEKIGNIIAPSAFSLPAPTTIGGVRLSDIGKSVENYNASNDLNPDAINAPLFPTDGTAISHSVNSDGSVDISVSWEWYGDESSIDGFAIVGYSSKSNHGSSYVIGTNPDTESVFQFTANRRGHTFQGLPATNYYTVDVVAYRAVNKHVVASGLITSTASYMTEAGERPYRPEVAVSFNGDDVGGIPTGDINKWSAQVDDDGNKPDANANRSPNTYAQGTAPTVDLIYGDMWIDTSDFNRLNRYDDTIPAWVPLRDGQIQVALDASQDAQYTADGKVVTYYQPTKPTIGSVGDLWMDSDNGYLHVYESNDYVRVKDGDITSAANLAIAASDNSDLAYSLADSKIVTFYSTTQPTAASFGDVWYNKNTNLLKRFNDVTWEDVGNGFTDTSQLNDDDNLGGTAVWGGLSNRPTDTELLNTNTTPADIGYTGDLNANRSPNTYAQSGVPASSTTLEGDIWIETDQKNRLKRYDGSGWVVLRDTGIATAQATADGKVVTFYQPTEPTASEGDLWVDSNDNKLYRHNGVNFSVVQDNDISSAAQLAAVAKSAADDAGILADSKIVTFYGTSNPTGMATGDLWYNSSSKLFKRYSSGGSWVLVSNAYSDTNDLNDGARLGKSATWTDVTGTGRPDDNANVSPNTYARTSAPSSDLLNGDLWMDTSDGNKLYRYSTNSTSWVSMTDAGIQTALDAAAASQSTADGKIVAYYQSAMPAGSLGDIWMDSDNGYLYTHNGTAYVRVKDTDITSANSLAIAAHDNSDLAYSLADSKIVTFYGSSTPANAGSGDLWYNTSTKVLRRYDGSSWAATSNNTTATSQLTDDDNLGGTATWNGVTAKPSNTQLLNANTTPADIGYTGDLNANRSPNTYAQNAQPSNATAIEGDLWIETDQGNRLKRYNGSGWSVLRDATIATAQATADLAKASADGKIVVFYQTTAPTTGALGDLWLDADDNKLYRHNGSNFVAVQDDDIGAASLLATAANSAAQDANTLADSKIVTFYGSSNPTGMEEGDLWFNSSSKLMKRYSGSSWASVGNAYTNTSQLTDDDNLGGTADWGSVNAKPTNSQIYNQYTTPSDIGYTGDLNANKSANTYAQTSAPTTGLVDGDIWIDTNDGNRTYRYDLGSTSFVDMQDAAIAVAQATADAAGGGSLEVGYNYAEAPESANWAYYHGNSSLGNYNLAANGSALVMPAHSSLKLAELTGLSLEQGKNYILSFYAVIDSGTALVDYDLYPDTLPGGSVSVNTTPTRHTAILNSSNADILNCSLRFFVSASTASTVRVYNIKLEMGSAATVVSPSAEDMVTLKNKLSNSNVSNYMEAGTITADQIYAGAVTAQKIQASQIYAINLSALSADFGTMTAGSVSTSGYVVANGYYSSTEGAVAMAANTSYTQVNGMIGYSSHASGVGLLGRNTGSGIGVDGYSSSGIGVWGSTSTGVAVYCNGVMAKSGTELVANLNADMVNSYHASQLVHSVLVDTGSNVSPSNGHIGLYMSTGLTAYETYNAGGGSIYMRTDGSDRRLKEEILPETLGLSFIKALQPVTYLRIGSRVSPMTGQRLIRHGLIAQDVQDIIGNPDIDCMLERREDDGMLSLDYSALITPTIKAVQELSTIVEQQAAIIADLTARLTLLEN